MTEQQMRELVDGCGLDWHRGCMPLFDGDPTNRYAVLIEAVVAAERERCAKICDAIEGGKYPSGETAGGVAWECADAIRGETP